MQTHVIEGREWVLDGSTTCPRPEWCDHRDDEAFANPDDPGFAKYVRRHAKEHELDFPSQTSLDDMWANLTLNCGYFGHKYTIGNRTLTPFPFWQTHEFVFNWTFHPDDLEMGLWNEPDWAVATEFTDSNGVRRPLTYELKPFDERLPGIYKRFKEVELPRGCQKTSIVSKAYVTISHLRQRFLFDNIYHRIIITSATTTLTEGVTSALRTLWERNRNLRRMFGIDRFKTRQRVDRKTGEVTEEKTFVRRDAIYGSKTKNTVSLRWTKDADDSSGLTSFAVLYAGIGTETQGQRADEYVFDDGSTKKNSKTQARREQVVEAFTEQIRQLDPNGRMFVCNTRQHLHDFGGKIKSPEYRELFHIMHRRARYIDGATGEEKAFYPIDGTGTEKYSLRALDALALVTPESDMWAEFYNCPRDPTKTVFRRDQFQVIDIDDPRVPIEVKYGLGQTLTPAQTGELAAARVSIRAFNTCDPAGKEEQSVKGDSTWVGGHRFDRYGNWWIVFLSAGQWDSDTVWRENYRGWAHNRPSAADYELPASELHVRGSFDTWKANEAATLGFPIPMHIDWGHMPKAGKASRIEALTTWTKNRRIYILTNAAPRPVIDLLLSQFHDYPLGDHDDGPDMVSRCLRYVQPPSQKDAIEAAKAKEGPRMVDGKLIVTQEQLLSAFKETKGGSVSNWGLRGGRKRIA